MHGHLDIETLEPESNHDLFTEKIVLYNETESEEYDTSGGLFGKSGEARTIGEIVGIWMRIETILPSGEKLCREYCSPRYIAQKYEWKQESFAVGLNEPPKQQKRFFIPTPRFEFRLNE